MEAVDANRCRTRAVRIAATDASGPPPPAPASQPPGVAMAKQPSFRARPRRSCMRRRSTATTASSSGPASDELSDPSIEPSPSPAMARAVSFAENLTVQEYGMILGDHPGVMDNGYVSWASGLGRLSQARRGAVLNSIPNVACLFRNPALP
jgi:hypothetical protein